MTTTNYPALMGCLEDLIRTKRYHDAEQLLRDAREYAKSTPPPDDTWILVAEGMRDRMIRESEGMIPTVKELAERLVALKLYKAATKEVIDQVLL